MVFLSAHIVHIAQNSSNRDTPDYLALLTELSDDKPGVKNAGVGSRKKSPSKSKSKKTSGKPNSSPSNQSPESSVTKPKILEASSDVIYGVDIVAIKNSLTSESNDLSSVKSKIVVNSKYMDEVYKNISDTQTDYTKKCQIFYQNLVLLNSFFQQGLDLSEINKVFSFPEPEISAFDNKLKTNCINQLIVILLSSTKDYLSKKSKGTKTKKSVKLFVTESCKLLRVDYSQVHVLQKLYENLQSKGFSEASLVGGLATLLVQHTLGLVAKVDMTLTSDIDLVLILDFVQRQKLLSYLRSFAFTLQKATEDYCSCSIMFEKTKVDLVIYNKSALRPAAIDSKKSFEVALKSSFLKFAHYRDILLLFNKERLFDKRALANNACALAYYLREHARDKCFSFVPSFADVSRDNLVIVRKAICLYLTKYVYSTKTIFYSYFSDKLIRFIPGFEEIKAIIHSISEVLLAVDNANSKINYLPFTMIMLNFFENKKPIPTNNFPKGIEVMANMAIKELTCKDGKDQEQKAIIDFIQKSKSALNK